MADSSDWKPIEIEYEETALPDAPDDKGRLRRRTLNHLLEVQLSQHLMIVAGLGTSLCVTNDKGEHPAPTMGGLWEAVSKAAGAGFAKVISTVKHPVAARDIEALLSRCHLSQHLAPDAKIEEFIKVAEKTIGDLCRAITKGPWPLPHHETFIRRLTSRPTRLPRFKLFTTNYDLCWERAASNVKAVIVDGFTHADPQEFDGECFSYDVVTRPDNGEGPEYIPKVFHLGKLHGSIDWNEVNGRVLKGHSDKPVMIYPRENKYQVSYSQPFLELMARFQHATRTPNTGIIIAGFGFNDEHLAQPIISAIKANPSIRVVVVDPFLKSPVEGRPGFKHMKFLEHLVRAGDKRIALVNATFEQYVALMPELSVVPEAEAHKQRLLGIDRR